MLSQQLTLLLYDAKLQDDTVTLLSLSTERNLKQKYSSNKVAQIHAKYNAEEELIQNQLKEVSTTRKENSNNFGDANSAEIEKELLTQYEELKGELNELRNAEDKEVSNVEEEMTNYENQNDIEQSAIQTDMQATKEDRDAVKENLKQDIETTFGYFKN